jgi:hypothetical protein
MWMAVMAMTLGPSQRSTPVPASSTTPATSMPSENGSGRFMFDSGCAGLDYLACPNSRHGTATGLWTFGETD